MRIVIAGGSGFLGRALTDALRHQRHDVTVLSRNAAASSSTEVRWQPDGTAGAWAHALDGADAVVNLAGEGVAEARWTPARKVALRESRLLPTHSLVVAFRVIAHPPAVLVNASGIGYYGPRDASIVTEADPPGTDFLGQLCVAWEREAEQASSRARVALLRSGLVLHPSGGALARMLPPFRVGLGGRLGSGTQYLPWIHLDDWVALVIWLITTPEARGAFNVIAPQPVTNAEFTQTLARTLGRPAVIPVPAFALRLALGELADTLLTGQRAIPARAQDMGFAFRFVTLRQALDSLLK